MKNIEKLAGVLIKSNFQLFRVKILKLMPLLYRKLVNYPEFEKYSPYLAKYSEIAGLIHENDGHILEKYRKLADVLLKTLHQKLFGEIF